MGGLVTETPTEMVSALWLQHRYDLAAMQLRLAKYRALLEQHGIPVPDDDGKDALDELRRCRKVVAVVNELFVALDEFRESLGTSKELLAETWR